jgi:hypothetical protein
MNTLARILEISSRLDHLANCADWLSRETVHVDNSLSQTGTLMTVLVEDIRERVNDLVTELEEIAQGTETH